MTDQFDRASELEQEHRDRALAAHRNRPIEEPDEDEYSVRYCLDCSHIIPKQRVELVPHAVRCVSCQNKKERTHG
ncbi:MAG: TraR/DksA family transcriptional regulator [Marinomonas sp.]|uniref:TraR/DksA family transcriptional regulator n=1 Tax=Marinomonas sp. TaxID=1904862 RepID=UPI003F98FF5C